MGVRRFRSDDQRTSRHAPVRLSSSQLLLAPQRLLGTRCGALAQREREGGGRLAIERGCMRGRVCKYRRSHRLPAQLFNEPEDNHNYDD